jgi:type II secretory pathway component GspD/PulD (secretin)
VTSVNTEIMTTGYGLSGTASTNFVQNVTPTAFNFGIALSVTPQIRDNDQVRLWLNPEVRTKTGEKSFDQKQIINGSTVDNTLNLPTTSWQAVWTNVIVHDGDTLVLGGMVRDQSTKSEQKLPYIADIPVIGFFFKGKSREAKQSSLLIFVTPDIIDSTGARFFDIGRENMSSTQNTPKPGPAANKSAAAKAPLKASGKGVNKAKPDGPVKSVAPPTPIS